MTVLAKLIAKFVKDDFNKTEDKMRPWWITILESLSLRERALCVYAKKVLGIEIYR